MLCTEDDIVKVNVSYKRPESMDKLYFEYMLEMVCGVM